MTVRADIAGVVNNDLTFTFSLTYNNRPLDLTAYTVSVVVKASQTALDNTGTTYTVGSGLTMISAVSGRFSLNIPRSSTTTAGNQWYRVDVSNGSAVSTAMCGLLGLMSA